MSYPILTRDEHFQAPGPKRILALDGGGLKGILTLGFLRRIEEILRERHEDSEEFRLCHYFDLIAGTSTGAIIAAGLAMGMTVSEIAELYLKLGRDVFKGSFLRRGVIRARYDENRLEKELKRTFGADTTLGGDALKTGVLIVTKRLDTGSPWPLGNNPKGKYFRAPEGAEWISNGEYPLWKVVRASTAAPSYFDPEKILISRKKGKKAQIGVFVDGGVSPFNNPALQALMYATLDGYKVGWSTGARELLLVSVGTGMDDPAVESSWAAAGGAVNSLLGLMKDCATLMETLMQWMGTTPTARPLDGEIQDLARDQLGGSPLFTYLRFDLPLTREGVEPLKPGLKGSIIESLSAMDKPKNLDLLKELGEMAGNKQVLGHLFPEAFDLKE